MGQGSSKSKITAQDDAILAMKTQRDKLQQYQRKIAVVSARETEVARECLRRGDKQKALVALRRKKYQESLLAKTDAQLEQLEILVNDIEFARVQKDVVYGLQQGTMVLKQIHKEMGGVEGVEKLLADNEEASMYQKEINELLAGRMSNQDEDEVEDELEALEQEINAVEEPTHPLPNAPSQEPRRRETQKERWERRAQEQREQREAVLA